MLNQNKLVEGEISHEDIGKKSSQNPNPNDTKIPGSEYTRGCSHITRCRGGHHDHNE